MQLPAFSFRDEKKIKRVSKVSLAHLYFEVRSSSIEVIREFFLSFLLSKITHQNFFVCVVVISRIKSHKIFIETRDENIDIESILSILRSSLRDLIRLQIDPQKDKLSSYTSVYFNISFSAVRTDDNR